MARISVSIALVFLAGFAIGCGSEADDSGESPAPKPCIVTALEPNSRDDTPADIHFETHACEAEPEAPRPSE